MITEAHMKLIYRDDYMKKLTDVIGTPDIKVITGVRRSGKSKLLEAFAAYVQREVDGANIIRINFNLLEFESLKSCDRLHAYVEERYVDGAQNFVLIDEVQLCDGFEVAINSLHATEKYDIYITGSNAFLLSSDLATLFTGRTFEIKVFPFSFKEYLKYFELTDKFAAIDAYLKDGGLPGSYLYRDIGSRYDYVADVFKTLIVRDIRQKYRIRNDVLMDKLVDFLLDNVSNVTSTRSIVKALSGEEASHKTVGKYIQYLCNAFAFYKVRRYDIVGKKYLASSDKYYLCDHAFRYAVLGTKNADWGRMLENIVAIELMRRGYEVYAGCMYKTEIDFVAVKRGEKIYFQVADNIDSSETRDREVKPLLRIADAYPKILLSRTRHEEYDLEGVRVIDIADWLTR